MPDYFPHDMHSMQHVFVYGTLRAGEANDIHRAARRHDIAEPVLMGRGHTPGRLYDFGSYPGLVLDPGAGPVRGDVYRVDAALIPVLDEIEEVFPGVEGLFRSVRIDVTVNNDGHERVIDCLVYPVGENAVAGLTRIEKGDWVAYRRQLMDRHA
jgi:gamma-glutamylcyclotransferase (GGCT)/AIG2-like uncharacterized protein YtfP